MIRIAAVALTMALSTFSFAATIEPVKNDGADTYTIILEGEITAGDEKHFFQTFSDKVLDGETVASVQLYSKGGDVDEAIKLGKMIRRLRLITIIPKIHDGISETDIPSGYRLRDNRNQACASSCFLVFAGGIWRIGNVALLHRPFISRDSSRNYNDLERERLQKDAMNLVVSYLKDMEVNQFFIDKTIQYSSQDSYQVTQQDAESYDLNEPVPSIEEIVLSKCDSLKKSDKYRPGGIEKYLKYQQCKFPIIQELKRSAFIRELRQHASVLESKSDAIKKYWAFVLNESNN